MFKDMINHKIESKNAPKPLGNYPHARRVGQLLFLSGVGPRQRGEKEIPGVVLNRHGKVVSYNIETQCHAVFNNVKVILEDSGSCWDNLVDITVFLTDMKKDFNSYNTIYSQYFKNNSPTRTTLGITSLPTPIAIELKCIATIK